MTTPPSSAKGLVLPPLRQDLRIETGAVSSVGAKTWVIYDPLQHKYIQIDDTTKALFSIWNEATTAEKLLDIATSRLGLAVDYAMAAGLVDFVLHNHLSVGQDQENWRAVYAKSQARRQAWWSQLAHNYLYFRIPLFQPNEWLVARLPLVAPLFSRAAAWIVAALGAAGVYFVSQQWEEFLTTFPNFFSLEGAVAFTVSLFIVKAFHELGHAFTAARFGCRVPTMGIAFMVLAPMLYTDVSDAWRLRNRRERFLIGAAGVVVELAIACLATFLWVFLPDGIIRSIVFVLATTSWIMSVGLNLNPFMRFDGYYLLMDATGIDNLQPRSFSLGRWKLRELLFAPGNECPELLAPATRRWMIFYAWLVWIYRLVLFTGIAILVYSYFFKALGLVLFMFEIWYFVLYPMVTEFSEWRKVGLASANRRRLALTSGAFATVLVGCFVPWSSPVYVPAVIEAADTAQVFPPVAGEVEAVDVAVGQHIAKDAVLLRLSSTDLDREIERAQRKVEATRLRLARTVSDDADRDQRLVLIREYDALQAEIEGYNRQKQELVIRAPVSGRILQLEPHLHKGRWISEKTLIAIVGEQKSYAARGYVTEHDAGRVALGREGVFIPDDILRNKLPVSIARISEAGAASIDILELASDFGGKIGVQADEERRLIPVRASYNIELRATVSGWGFREQTVRGVALIPGTPESLASRTWQSIIRILIRESGF